MADRESICELQGNTLLIRARPEYDDPEFLDACRRLLDCKGPELIIDLSAVEIISSREVGVLIGTAKKARVGGQKLILRVSKSLNTLFHILNLRHVVTIEEAT